LTRRSGPPATERRKPLTVGQLIRSTATRLRNARLTFAHGTTDPVAEAAFLVAETLGLHPDQVEARADAPVTPSQCARVAKLARQRIRTRKPAAYLLGRIYLRGVPFIIDQRAIVPRSYLAEVLDSPLFAGESFSLVRDPRTVKRVLDLCTGSGCLAILAAKRFPHARVDATDISPEALELARKNVALHRLNKRVRIMHGDLFAPVKTARYDLIVANPPYVDAKTMRALPAECRHEPKLALYGGRDGLAVIRRILDEAGRHLTPNGGLLCEVGRGRRAIERAYPRKRFLWLDTEESSGEAFWVDASELR
jgi:ribosomal protein L3 glutamine methyltransferase